MSTPLDAAQPVRPGEELAIPQLAEYLRQHLPGEDGPLEVEQFPGGHSNLTYLLRRGGREYVLRRPPFGNVVRTAHDMGREFRVLSRLHRVYPFAPEPLLSCEDESILGVPFYVMERRKGIVLRKGLPRGLALDAERMRQLCLTLVDNLVSLHALDYRAIGLGDLGKPDGYVARQVAGWSKRYQDARTNDVPELEQTAAWLASHQPAESGAAVIHNDFKFDNLLLDPNDITRIVAVLDWEMATVGDPLMDLGTSLGYWVEAHDSDELKQLALGPTALPGCLTRRQLVDRYVERSGRDVPQLLFYYSFGLFKLAVILQQIYARYVRGQTHDPRFARFDESVAALGRATVRVLQTGTV